MRTYWLSVLSWLALAGSGLAHPQVQNSMWVLVDGQEVRLGINVSIRELAVVEGVPIDELGGAQQAAAELHAHYLLKHIEISQDGEVLVGKFNKLTPPLLLGGEENTFYLYEFEYPLRASAGSFLNFSQSILAEHPYAPGQSFDVSYVTRIKRAGSEEMETALLRAGSGLSFRIDGTLAKNQGVFVSYLKDGIHHILSGYDHLLFVAALVLAALSLWEMVKVVGVFTIAHTLTLGLSVFNLVRLPAWVVEPTIAASIVFVALENVIWPNRSQRRVRLWVAFGFGLVHGLGFAGGLLEAMEGLPQTSLWLALAAFSLGVEIGHQLVVVPLFGLLRLGQRLGAGFRPAVLRYGSAVISACGLYYLVHALTQA